MPGIDKMKLFCSESISEGDKLTIRAYKDNFCVKRSPSYSVIYSYSANSQ